MIFRNNSKACFGNSSQLEIRHDGSSSGYIRQVADGYLRIYGNDALHFYTTPSGGSATERLRIDSGGRLIQRYSAAPYDNRAATFQSPAGQGQTYIAIVNTETNGSSGILFGDHAGQNSGNFDGYINYSHQYQHMQFMVNAGNERFRIASQGQLGIGGANYGTSGQVLTSQGASAAPQWASVSAFNGALDGMIFGGVETTYTSGGTTYKVHTFLSTGFLRVTATTTMDILIVGGGGGSPQAEGYQGSSGGGGAGGMVEGSSISVPAGKHTMTVGAGGVATNQYTVGGTGGDSTFAINGGSTITAKGGGGGADYAATGGTG